MLKWLLWGAVLILIAVAADRVLLWLERRGWIYYRRTRGVRGRAMYHAQELDSIFNPGMQHVQEAHHREEEEEDESGEPPVRSTREADD